MDDEKSEAIRLSTRLDKVLPPGNVSSFRNNYDDPTIDTAMLLAEKSGETMPADMRDRIRARILASDQSPSYQPSLMSRMLRWPGLRAVASIVLILSVLLLVGSVPVSASAVPGDLLYPVKIGLEKVELAIVSSHAQRASIHLVQASRRLIEADELLARGQFHPELFEAAFDSVTSAGQLVDLSSELYAQRLSALNAQLNTLINNARQHVNASTDQIDIIIDSSVHSGMATAVNTLSISPQPVLPPSLAVATNQTVEEDQTDTQVERMVTPVPEVPPSVPMPTHSVPVVATLSTEVLVVSATTTEEPNRLVGEVSASGIVNVRSGPGTSFSVIGAMSPGDSVQIVALDETGDWLQVVIDDGLGWIFEPLIDVDMETELPIILSVGSTPSPVPGSNEVGNGNAGNGNAGNDNAGNDNAGNDNADNGNAGNGNAGNGN